MKTLVHFGAGNIGRSLVGVLFTRAGYHVVFVDADRRVVDAINQRRGYEVRTIWPGLPPEKARTRVENVSALHAGDENTVAATLGEADLAGTSVGAKILPRVLPVIARGLTGRERPLAVIMCENLRHAAARAREVLRAHLPPDYPLRERVGLVETSIGKMVPIIPAAVRARDPLAVWAEPYTKIIADRAGFLGEVPRVAGLEVKDNFAAYVDLKLFVHNFGHAAAAYLGHLAGYHYIWECMRDPNLRGRVRAGMLATGAALRTRYPGEFTPGYVRGHVDDLLERFANRALGDTVFRVGRDLARKLGADDRCLGALRLLQETGADTDFACEVIAAALLFDARDETGESLAGDRRIVERAAHAGVEPVLQEVCGMSPSADRERVEHISACYRRLDTGSKA